MSGHVRLTDKALKELCAAYNELGEALALSLRKTLAITRSEDIPDIAALEPWAYVVACSMGRVLRTTGIPDDPATHIAASVGAALMDGVAGKMDGVKAPHSKGWRKDFDKMQPDDPSVN